MRMETDQLAIADRDPFELFHEINMEEGPAVLTIGDPLKPDIFL